MAEDSNFRESQMYYVYILVSERNGKSYVGFTSKETKQRLREHNLGSNQWTSLNKPFRILYYESYICKEDALRRENFLKSGVGKKLVKLIKENY